jgi:small conductance mechanosensitive channel
MKAEISIVWKKMQSMIDGFMIMLPNIVLALIVFAIFFVFGREIKRVVRRVTRHHHQARNLGLVLGRLAQSAIVLVGLFISLSIVIPTLKAGDLVQLLGISGVAIGFAFRDILQNFLAGILILLTEPFRIDDQIVFKNFEGTVENIETRATTILTYDGRRIVIPNAELFTNSVTVNTAFVDIHPAHSATGIPKTHNLGFCFIAPALTDLLCSGLTVAPQTLTASPAARIFLPAFSSLS